MPTLSQQADKALIDAIKAEKPSRFSVGATADILQRKAELTVSYNRTIWNGLGLTAYLKAWWHDRAVIPEDRHGAVIGIDGDYRF